MNEREKIFLLYSALQKSIRWCEVNNARYFARELIIMGQPGGVLNRLVIFAAEDIGFADPTLVKYVGQCYDEFEDWEEKSKIKRSKASDHPEALSIIDRAVIATALCYKSRLLDMCICTTLYDIYCNESFDCSFEDYRDSFLDAVRRDDEEKALYYAYIIREVFDSGDSVLEMIKDSKGKPNSELINEWIEVYEKAKNGEGGRLLYAGIVSLLFREINYEHGEYLRSVDSCASEPIEEADIPDRAHDMHTRTDKSKGRGLEHFLDEAASLRNERFTNDWEDKGRQALFAAEREGLRKAPKLIDAIMGKYEKRRKQ